MKLPIFGLVLLGICSLGVGAIAAEGEPQALGLTIYNPKDKDERADKEPSDEEVAWKGFAVVRDTRRYTLQAGQNRDLAFTQVASQMDETSVKLRSLTAPDGFRLLSQSYIYDLPCLSTLLTNYLEKPIILFTDAGRFEGTLLGFDKVRLTMRSKEPDGPPIVALRGKSLAHIALPEPLKGLRAKPTLLWDAEAAQAGQQDLQVSYVAQEIGWRADYNLVINDDETRADLSAWATIFNHSGASYENAQLKLVAGEVEREKVEIERECDWEWEEERCSHSLGKRSAGLNIDGDSALFQEKPFFEYHLYSLPRPVGLPENGTKQLELFQTAQDLAFSKVYLYSGAKITSLSESPNTDAKAPEPITAVLLYAKAKNTTENHLGWPLPKGRVRVFKREKESGELLYLGEDVLSQTARGESFEVKLGQSFDLRGERRLVSFKSDAHDIRESIEITLHNDKPEAVTVQVRELLYRHNSWKLEKNPDGFKRLFPLTIETRVTVPPGGQKKVSYTVHYSIPEAKR